MLKKGTQLEQDKQYIEASNFYFEVLNLKKQTLMQPSHSTGWEKVLNKYLSNFYQERLWEM